MNGLKSRFVPATGLGVFLKWYDPLVARFTREKLVKEHLLERLRDVAGLKILDVGCGTGTLALSIVQNNPDALVIGLDIDSRILKQASRKALGAGGAERVTWVEASALSIPLQDAGLDAVSCSLFFHHLDHREKQAVLVEIFRVLRPRGRFVVADYGKPKNYWAALRFVLVRALDGWSRTRDNRQGSLPALIRETGFESVVETLELETWLGTLRCWEATKP